MQADPEPTTPPPTHLDLLAISRAVRRAVVDEDTDTLHTELARLRAELVRHMHHEHQRAPTREGAGVGVVKDGQHRLLGLLDEVILDAHTDVAECSCLVRATVIERAIQRQARLEATLLDRQARDEISGGDRS